jgi:hypothetical protein
MAKTKKPEPTIIAQEEWDFSDRFTGRHLWACWIYEFTREYVKGDLPEPSRALVHLPKPLREKAEDLKWLVNTPFQIALKELTESPFESEVSETLKDWLKINTGPVRLAVGDPEDGEMAYIVGPGMEDGIPEIVGGDSEENVTRLVIDWNKKDTELCKGFKNLIGGLRPREPKETRGRSWARRTGDDLIALGAYRLLKANFTAFGAIEHTEEIKGDRNSPYAHSAEWSKAKKRALSVLSRWPPSFRLGEWPNDLI